MSQMDYFNLSLRWRLALACLSGSSMGLLMQFPGLGTSAIWIAASLFGLLVLVPFMTRSTHRLMRAAALILTSVAAQWLVVFLTIDLSNYLGLDELEMIINVLIGSLLICVATALISPLTLQPRYILYAAAAGLISGASFYLIFDRLWRMFCIEPCPWYNDLVFVSGWIIWYTAICAAIYLGKVHRATT